MTIGFVGLSHLGIVSSVAAASKGFNVIGFDPDSTLCDALSQGRIAIIEPGLPELFSEHRGRLRFTSEARALGACDLLICSADVPTDADGRSELTVITTLVETMVAHAPNGATVVVLSQVPPGFTRRLAPLGLARHLQLFYQVETLIFGQGVERVLHPERFIIGCADAEAALPEPYARLLGAFGCPVLRMRYESAELAKLAINMFLISSVTTANTLAELCEAIGADWSEVVPALRLDQRIGARAYLQPGLGLSGGNLERDLATVRRLAEEHGSDVGVVDAWLTDSRYRRDWVLRRLHADILSRVGEPILAVWGLAYKAQTNSTKNSPALALIDALPAVAVRVYDPQVTLNGVARPHVTQTASALEACRGADALAVMTPWPEFAAVSPSQIRELMRGRVVLDPFGVLNANACAADGLQPHRLGAPLQTGACAR